MPDTEIGSIALDQDITLRRMIVRAAAPKGTVLLLHGFPETLLAFQDIAHALAEDYDVHAFDWPGYGGSSRPSPETFSYVPSAYARVLRDYIDQAGIDRSTLTIYATDISGLPALLLALEEPDIARSLIVGDFAPLDRPALMYPNLQGLKAEPSATPIRAAMKAGRDEILANTFHRGLPPETHFPLAPELRDDLALGWGEDETTVVDAFAHYYAHFTRDQEHFEANHAQLTTPLRLLWGSEDFYIDKAMGAELADRLQAPLRLLSGVGHYAHLQAPQRVIDEIRAAAC